MLDETLLTPNIAIVDDENDLVDVYTRLFRLKKMNVCFTASNGQEAVELYRNASVKPHIIIMDNRMPVMNGVDAMRAIMAIDNNTCFIFMSADASVRDEVAGMGAMFLKKPVSLRVLMKAIESLSSGHDNHRSSGSGPFDGPAHRAALI